MLPLTNSELWIPKLWKDEVSENFIKEPVSDSTTYVELSASIWWKSEPDAKLPVSDSTT